MRERVVEIARALPEAVGRPRGRHVGFEVRGRRFAWYLDDHHGDGRVAVVCKVESDINRDLVASNPDRYFIPSYLGPRGWVGLSLDNADIDWDEVAELVFDSYRLVAPRSLVALAESTISARDVNH